MSKPVLAGAVLLLLTLPVSAQLEQPRRILLTSLQAGEPLTAAELEIRIGKKPAEILRVYQAEERPVRLLLIISDDPGSRLVQNLAEVRQFVENLPDATTIQVSYARGGTLKIEQPFTGELAAAGAALRLPTGALPPQDLGLLLSEAMAQFPEDGSERAQIVYLGEGTEPEADDLFGDPRLNRAIRQAQERGIVVWTIHTGSASGGDAYVDRLSKETGGRSLGLGHPPSLAPHLRELRAFLDRQYLVEFVPPANASGKLEVRVRGERRQLLHPER